MSWATAIVIIVALAIFAEVIKSKHRAQRGVVQDAEGNERPIERHDAALQREVEDLRERIKVLERIATEDRETKRLSAEIDALRTPARLEEGSKQ